MSRFCRSGTLAVRARCRPLLRVPPCCAAAPSPPAEGGPPRGDPDLDLERGERGVAPPPRGDLARRRGFEWEPGEAAIAIAAAAAAAACRSGWDLVDPDLGFGALAVGDSGLEPGACVRAEAIGGTGRGPASEGPVRADVA